MRQVIAITLLMLLLTVVFTTKTKAQVEIEGGITLTNQPYWRGFSLSPIPGGSAEATISTGNFSFCLWGAAALDFQYTELDFIPTYSIGDFDLSLVHYYNPIYGETNHFFDFSDEGNRHSTEFMVVHNANKFPLNVTIGTFFFNDKNEETGNTFFSTYAEIGFPFSLKWVDAEIAVGLTPAKGYYAENTAIIHSSFTLYKDFELKNDFYIPTSLGVNYNPYANEAFVVLSIGLYR